MSGEEIRPKTRITHDLEVYDLTFREWYDIASGIRRSSGPLQEWIDDLRLLEYAEFDQQQPFVYENVMHTAERIGIDPSDRSTLRPKLDQALKFYAGLPAQARQLGKEFPSAEALPWLTTPEWMPGYYNKVTIWSPPPYDPAKRNLQWQTLRIILRTVLGVSPRELEATSQHQVMFEYHFRIGQQQAFNEGNAGETG